MHATSTSPTTPPRAIAAPSAAAREALAQAVSDLDQAEQRSQPARLALSLAQVGRCYRGLGDLASAEWYLLQSLRWAHTLGGADACIELSCELAELAVSRAEELKGTEAHAARERARDHSFEAARLADRAADRPWETAVLLRVSEVLDRCGDHDDAIALQCRALSLISGQPRDVPASLVAQLSKNALM